MKKKYLIWLLLLFGLANVQLMTTSQAQTINVNHQEIPEINVLNNQLLPKASDPIIVNLASYTPQPAQSNLSMQLIKTYLTSEIDAATVDFSANALTQTAQQYLGVPYVWGGSTPNGFDCSGLVQYVAQANGIALPRTSQQQSTYGTYVDLSQIQPGDLLFWGGVGTAEHVAIYLGNGEYIHAPQPGQNVKIGTLQWFTPSFGRRII